MLLEEFKTRTGYTPSLEEYAEIERQYYDFAGNKDEFCAYWKNHHDARFIVWNALEKTLNRVYKREGGNTPLTNAVADYVNFIQTALYSIN